jgi:hypothetical protein
MREPSSQPRELPLFNSVQPAGGTAPEEKSSERKEV